MKKIDLTTLTESSYYYNEVCDDCGYKSFDYAKYFAISYNDLNLKIKLYVKYVIKHISNTLSTIIYVLY